MRRFALRRLRSDEGLGLLETVVALFVFSLIMTGLAGSMVMFAHQTSLNRARASAASLAQQYVEKARAVGGTSLENCNNATPLPPSTTTFHGKTGLTVWQGSDANCIKYQTSTTQDNLSFTVTRTVILVQPSQNDVAGQAQTEKYFVVNVSWTDAGGASKSYELDTIFNQKGSATAAPAQGIRFVIKDINGNILTADSSTWAVSIKDASGTVYTATDAATAEGTYSQLDLSPGTYTCTAQSTNDASSGYYPGGQPTYNSGMTLSSSTSTSTNDTVSGSCTVTASTVTDFVTTWQSLTDCAKSSVTGTVNFVVTNQATKAALSGMTVTMTNLSDSTKTYTKNTGANGHADGLKPIADWYTYTVTDTTGVYVTGSFNSPYCVIAGSTVTINVQMSASGVCATTGANATVNITVQDATTQAKLGGYKVSVISASTGTSTAFPNSANNTGLSSKAIAPGSYYYLVTLPGASTYQGSGVLGPTCLLAGETRNITVGLSAATCTRNAGKKTAGLSFAIQDTAGNKIQNATIWVLNVDGDNPTVTGTSDVNGLKTFTGLPVGPYQYLVIGPNGNYTTSTVSTPVCASDGVTTSIPTVKLAGLMNITVTVQNNDVVPWKNYEIDVIDSSGNTQGTQYVTVPDCTPGASGCSRNPSAGIPFTGLTTGNYTIQVCAFLASQSNCNLVDTAPTQSGTSTTYYQFLTPGATYTSSTTGYGDLATVDDSGGA